MQWECCPDPSLGEEEPPSSFRRDSYRYLLPAHLIAQHPLPNRDESRLMVLGREGGDLHHSTFRDLRVHLREGDLLVVNESRVFPARLVGHKVSGGRADLLLLQPRDPEESSPQRRDVEDSGSGEWDCLLRTSGRPKAGQALCFPHGLRGIVTGSSRGGVWGVRFSLKGGDLLAYLETHGLIPLPPYLRRGRKGVGSEEVLQDRDRYQTVFARKTGSVAAPTAGFHFTETLCKSLEATGIAFARISLHVGQATFLPIRAPDIRRHTIGPERYCVEEKEAEKIRKTKQEGRRVVAVGTTVVRCLESMVSDRGRVEAGEGWARMYILPGHRFELVDAMVTNFHLPETSLLVLVCAFAGREVVLRAYAEAVLKGYRFFSYGDCMLVQ
jgi:S-adenosylmethionine:tRNA ribosyltransferase-isomerase